MIEYERKFLVKQNLSSLGELIPRIKGERKRIWQGYISHDANLTIRVRKIGEGEVYKMTFKDRRVNGRCNEAEFDILPSTVGLMKPFLKDEIVKTRYYINYPYNMGKNIEVLTIELDIFEGALKGLMLAEIEGDEEKINYFFANNPAPELLGLEVTDDPIFSNSNLARLNFEQVQEHIRTLS